MNAAKWMTEALREAAKGLGDTAPNPAVGAVIVKKGKIISRGHHRFCGGPHAEAEALMNLTPADSRHLRDAIMVVTLEPCNHFGKTPPCTLAIQRANLRHVVIGMLDPHDRVAKKGVKALRQMNIRVDVLNDPDVIEFYEPYRTFHQKKRCFVTVKLAVSTDGKIARRGINWITGPKARREVQNIRGNVDAILVGRRTAKRDNPRLTLRTRAGCSRTRPPTRIILTRSGHLPRTLRVFTDGQAPTLVAAPPTVAQRLERKFPGREDVRILEVPMQSRGRMNLNALLRLLAKHNVAHLLVEGGAQTVNGFLEEELVDEIQMFVSPKILGAKSLSAFERGPRSIPQKAGKWKLVGTKFFGEDVWLRFRPREE